MHVFQQPADHVNELRTANNVIIRCTAILDAVASSNGSWCCENPACRSDPNNKITYQESLSDHGSLWQFPDMIALQKKHDARTATFAQCMLGSKWQKYTTIMFSRDLLPGLGPLNRLCCNHKHGEHSALAGRTNDGGWLSQTAAAYPPKMSEALAAALPPLINTTAPGASLTHNPEPPPISSIIQSPSPSLDSRPPPAHSHDQSEATPTANGPRPGGGTFELRKRTQNSSIHSSTGAGLCAIVPNSFTGRALQAIASNEAQRCCDSLLELVDNVYKQAA